MKDLLERFNYYSYSREVYEDCQSMIVLTNQRHSKIISVWFIAVNAFYLLCSLLQLMDLDSSRSGFYLSYIVATLFVMVFFVIREHDSPFIGMAATFLDLVIYISYSIRISIAEPYTTSWMFLLLMVIIALSFVETMLRMGAILVAGSLLFVRFSYLYKPHSIALMDANNTLVVVSLALILHFAFQRARISQFVTTVHDIKTQRQMEIRSSFDALTSLLNRARFFSMVREAVQDDDADTMALALLDLDGFKQINDSLGHQTGDRAIQIVGETIIAMLGMDLEDQWAFTKQALSDRVSFAGRLGGDEFIILFRGYDDRDAIIKCIYRIMGALDGVEEGDIHGLRASFGITRFKKDDRSIDDAYKRADEALYVSKKLGKNQLNFNRF